MSLELKLSSQNDTFVAARLWIDNPYWQGVPFYIRTGKRMAEKSTRIVVEFKNSSKREIQIKWHPNLLIIEINPNENVSLQINSRNPINGKVEPVKISFSTEQIDIPEAYERLIYDAFVGIPLSLLIGKKLNCHGNGYNLFLRHLKKISYHFIYIQQVPMALRQLIACLSEDGFKWWLDEDELEERSRLNS